MPTNTGVYGMKLDPECHTKEECEKTRDIICKIIDICEGTTVESKVTGCMMYDDLYASLKQIYELCKEYVESEK
jgi:hypothetical protein